MTSEPKEGTTRARVIEFLEIEGESSLNGIVLGVSGSAAAIRHAVESLLRTTHLIERKEAGAGTTFTRRIKINENYSPEGEGSEAEGEKEEGTKEEETENESKVG